MRRIYYGNNVLDALLYLEQVCHIDTGNLRFNATTS